MKEQRLEPKSISYEAERYFDEHPDASMDDWREKKELEREDRCGDDD